MERQGKRWCEDEVNEALEYLEQGWTVDEIAEQLERSYTAVLTKLKTVGAYVKREQRRYTRTEYKDFTEAEKDLVIEFYTEDKLSITEIANFFNVQLQQIRGILYERNVKDRHRGFRRELSKDEIQEMIDSGKMTLTQIAKEMLVGYETLVHFIERENIDMTKIKPTTRKKWTPTEVKMLGDLIADGLDFGEIGRRLARPAANCRVKAYSLGFKLRKADILEFGGIEQAAARGEERRRWTEEEEEKLERMYSNYEFYISDIALELDRSYQSVQAKITKMGLYKKYEKVRYEIQMQRLRQILKEGKN